MWPDVSNYGYEERGASESCENERTRYSAYVPIYYNTCRDNSSHHVICKKIKNDRAERNGWSVTFSRGRGVVLPPSAVTIVRCSGRFYDFIETEQLIERIVTSCQICNSSDARPDYTSLRQDERLKYSILISLRDRAESPCKYTRVRVCTVITARRL